MTNEKNLIKLEKPAVGELLANPWQNPNELRALFAPRLNDNEFQFFVSLGKHLGANPFMREIWAIKFNDNKPASIFLGRDFYRRKAQEQPEYEYHNVQAIYENDTIELETGILKKHIPSLKTPGKLLGAYCLVYLKNKENPFFVTVKFMEYNTGLSNWRKMPETMIKKVAEAQALRMAFAKVFRGTYDETEIWTIPDNSNNPDNSKGNFPEPVANPRKTQRVEPDNNVLKKPWDLKRITPLLDNEIRGFIGRLNFGGIQLIELFEKYNGNIAGIKADLTKQIGSDGEK